jgi:hypothetical protein
LYVNCIFICICCFTISAYSPHWNLRLKSDVDSLVLSRYVRVSILLNVEHHHNTCTMILFKLCITHYCGK